MWKSFVAAALLCMPVISGASAATVANADDLGHDVSVRVMSYNIHAGAGMDNVYNLDRTAAAIQSANVDIVGLQEVDVHWGNRSNYDDEIKLLAEKLHMNYFFAPIYNFAGDNTGDPPRQFGVAVLSKYPIIAEQNDAVTRLSTQESNPVPKPAPGFADVLINVKGVHLPVYVTHLDYRADPSVRQMQVKDMLDIIENNHRSQTILLGDMNAAPSAPELSPLFHVFKDAVGTATGPVYTYPASAPTTRDDYVLSTPNIGVGDVEVPSTLASDHRPVVATLTLNRGPQDESTDAEP